MVYSSRTLRPDVAVAPLGSFDGKMREAFTSVSGKRFDDEAWSQAALGLKHAGLGLRSTARHAPAAYLASRLSTRELCAQVDPEFAWEATAPDSGPRVAKEMLNAVLPPAQQVPLEDDAPRRQQALSSALDAAALQERLDRACPADSAAIRSELLPGASGFLSAVPSKTLGLAMEPPEFLVEVCTRLATPVYSQESFCPLCDEVLDVKGFHARTCMCGGDKIAGHNAARNLTGRYVAAAGLGPTLEKSDLLPPRPDHPSETGRRRPADVYIPSWEFGTPAALDLAITSPQRQVSLGAASLASGAAATSYEDYKRHFLDTESQCVAQGVAFLPIVAESSGGWGPSAMRFWRKLSASAGRQSSRSEEERLPQYLEGLSVAIRRASARAVLKRGAELGEEGADGRALAADVVAEADAEAEEQAGSVAGGVAAAGGA